MADGRRIARKTAAGGRTRKGSAAPVQRRMGADERRQQILGTAVDFFAEHGLTAQTRALAAACGISQRLLYRYFPSKEALLEDVYRSAIAGPFKATWFADLTDRNVAIEERLERFYRDYCATILTRRWLRLFVFSSLAEASMAPSYIASVVTNLTEAIVGETAFAQNVVPPRRRIVQHELGWVLHGAISHYMIRRHLYDASRGLPEAAVIRLHVHSFLAGFRAAVAACAGK